MRYDSPAEDFAYFTDCRRACRNCGRHSLHLEDGWCPVCNGEGERMDAEVREDNRRAWARFYKQHPELAR